MLNLRMLGPKPPTFLLASADTGLLASVEAVLARAGAHVEIARTAEAAFAAIKTCKPPDLALLDADLPEVETGRLLAAVRTETSGIPVILIANAVTEIWMDRLAAGVIDDLILRNAEPAYWELRTERTMRTYRLEYELATLREAAAQDVQHDRLTGVLNREALLAALFRETDRVQRAHSALSVILFDIDDFGHWNSRLGGNACDEVLCQIATRTARLLRSYDLFGRTGKDEFLIALPGCDTANATMLAERLRAEVFAEPLHVGGVTVRISACFGIAHSQGRSPVVVLREAEQAVAQAQKAGPESIQSFGASGKPVRPPATFLSSSSDEKILAW